MVSILMAADKADRHFADMFSDMFREYVNNNSLEEFACIRDIEDVLEPVSGKAIIVFQKAIKLPLELINPADAVVIVDSSSSELLGLVSRSGLPAITCGMRSKDTVTLSSLGADNAVVELRRAITGPDGTEIEPHEITASFARPLNRFALMAAAAAGLLLGFIMPDKEKSDAAALYYH